MRKRGIFVLFSVCLCLLWCWENKEEKNDATREPIYTDMEALQIHDRIVENFKFVPTCEEYKQCLEDFYWCTKILKAFNKDIYLMETQGLLITLDERLRKIGKEVENPKYYDLLQKEREEKIDKEIERCNN